MGARLPNRPEIDDKGRPVFVVVRPGKAPTRGAEPDDARWDYLTLDGHRLAQEAFLLHYPKFPWERSGHEIGGWHCEIFGWGPGEILWPCIRVRVERWAEGKLAKAGIEVISETEAQRRREKR